MKNRLAAVFAAFMLLFLTACASSSASDIPNGRLTEVTTSTGMQLPDRVLQAGETADLPLRFDPAGPCLGFQFGLAFDPEARSAELLTLPGLPCSILVDSRGQRLWLHQGFRRADGERLQARIAQALRDAS